jgi:hypothetical protein
MNAFTRAVSQIFSGAAKAFRAFPAVIGCALLFAVVAMVRIQLDWPEQEAWDFLLSSLHWSLALGALSALAAVTAAYSRSDRPGTLLAANLLGLAAAVVAFLLLFFLSGDQTDRALTLTALSRARVGVAILVSFLAFLILAGYPRERSDFARSFFMTHKAFFIALLYGLVLLGGLSGVAGAIQTLLYHDMSSKVYQYIMTVSGFIAFTIFVGYFPDFRKGMDDERWEIAQKQPRFIEVLFGYILVPIMLALTAVLLIWAIKTVVTGSWPDFSQLFGIAVAYAGGGVWLHMMVTHHDSNLTGFYRRVFPVATLVILAFEAWALMIQLGDFGMKITEYYFILIWIAAAAASVLLLLRRAWAHAAIVVLVCALSVFSVLPSVGYQALPVNAQVNRLETLLTDGGMLEGDTLVPARTEPALEVRQSITDAVNFLAYAEDARLPAWFDKELSDGSVFQEKLGFSQTWPGYPGDGGGYLETYLTLPNGAVDIGGYRWSVVLSDFSGKGSDSSVTLEGEKGEYRINWVTSDTDGIPTLKIERSGSVVLEQDLRSFLEQIAVKFPPGQGSSYQPDLEDMSLELETPEVTVLLVFSNISISVDTRQDTTSYWLGLDTLFLSENE